MRSLERALIQQLVSLQKMQFGHRDMHAMWAHSSQRENTTWRLKLCCHKPRNYQELGEREQILQRVHGPADTMTSYFWLCCLSHPFWGALLRQPSQTNVAPFYSFHVMLFLLPSLPMTKTKGSGSNEHSTIVHWEQWCTGLSPRVLCSLWFGEVTQWTVHSPTTAAFW